MKSSRAGDAGKQRGSGLLHNMSCAPRSQIQHTSQYRRVNGRGMVFALDPESDSLGKLLGNWGQLALPGIAQRCGGNTLSVPLHLEGELRRRIDAHARALPLPAAALVTDRMEEGDRHCSDLLTIVTVLAKSSGHVYLRDKDPNLSRIQPGRRVVLIVPSEWQR